MFAQRPFLAIVLAGALSFSAMAQTAEDEKDKQSSFDMEQVNAVEQIIYDYLMKHPEVIIEAVEVLQAREDAEAAAKVAKTLEEDRDKIYNSAGSYVSGNPNGDITIVEFFDYKCGFCKRGLDDLLTAVEQDSNVRLVFKEYPILSEESELASRAALASIKQNKYMDFHVALMRAKGALTQDRIDEIAKDIGINVKKLHKDMKDPSIDEQLNENNELAHKLDITGTPSFVAADQVFPGLLDKGQLTQLFADIRADNDKPAAVN